MEADATDWQLCSAGVCCHARGTDAKYCGNAMPDLAPTGSQLDHLLVAQKEAQAATQKTASACKRMAGENGKG